MTNEKRGLGLGLEAAAYQDTSLSPSERAADLVARMTLQEKVSQMIYDAPGIERLGVPPYNWWNECLHGVGRAGVATVFPQAIGLAATWNEGLMQEVAEAISDEARAKHHEALRRGVHGIYAGLTFWTPNINIFRDPRWGRGQETYGEDPFLTSRLGVRFIQGLQGDDPRYLKLVATAKHYAVHSGPESQRHTFDVQVGAICFRPIFLPSRLASRRPMWPRSWVPTIGPMVSLAALVQPCCRRCCAMRGASMATLCPIVGPSSISTLTIRWWIRPPRPRRWPSMLDAI